MELGEDQYAYADSHMVAAVRLGVSQGAGDLVRFLAAVPIGEPKEVASPERVARQERTVDIVERSMGPIDDGQHSPLVALSQWILVFGQPWFHGSSLSLAAVMTVDRTIREATERHPEHTMLRELSELLHSALEVATQQDADRLVLLECLLDRPEIAAAEAYARRPRDSSEDPVEEARHLDELLARCCCLLLAKSRVHLAVLYDYYGDTERAAEEIAALEGLKTDCLKVDPTCQRWSLVDASMHGEQASMGVEAVSTYASLTSPGHDFSAIAALPPQERAQHIEQVRVALMKAESEGRKSASAAAHSMLGHLYRFGGDFNDAEHHFRRSREIELKLGRYFAAAGDSFNLMILLSDVLIALDGQEGLEPLRLDACLAALAFGAEVVRFSWAEASKLTARQQRIMFEKAFPSLFDFLFNLAIRVGDASLFADLILNFRTCSPIMAQSAGAAFAMPHPATYRGRGWLGIPAFYRLAWPSLSSAVGFQDELTLSIEDILASIDGRQLLLGSVLVRNKDGERIITVFVEVPRFPVSSVSRLARAEPSSSDPFLEESWGSYLPGRVWELFNEVSRSGTRAILNVFPDPQVLCPSIGSMLAPSGEPLVDAFDVVYRLPPNLAWRDSQDKTKNTVPVTDLPAYWVCDPLGDLPWSRSVSDKCDLALGNTRDYDASAASPSRVTRAVGQGWAYRRTGCVSRPCAPSCWRFELLLEPDEDERLEPWAGLSLDEVISAVRRGRMKAAPGAGMRMLLLGCSTGKSVGHVDLTGFAYALVGVGVDVVISALRPIADYDRMGRVCGELVAALRNAEPIASFNFWQRRALHQGDDERLSNLARSLTVTVRW